MAFAKSAYSPMAGMNPIVSSTICPQSAGGMVDTVLRHGRTPLFVISVSSGLV